MKVDRYVLQQANKRNIIECIATDGPINQSAIAEKVGLSIPAVMKIVEEFERQGLVHSVGKGKSNGGKRPEMLELIRAARYAVGVDIGRSHLKLVVADLSGAVLYRESRPTGQAAPAEALIEGMCGMVEQAIAQSGIDEGRILGIGVGMPGLIDCGAGQVIFSPDFGWEDVPLRAMMQDRFAHRVMVENANLSLARGEHRFGSGQGADFLLCVNVGHGIGAGVVERGKPYLGSSGTSGEIGHMTMDKDGPLCACGNVGCLEALASGEAIARQALDIVQRGIRTQIVACAGGEESAIGAKEVFQAAALGDAPALSIVERATEYIGIALASCINLLDPDRIVLCGGLTKAGAPFIDRIKDQVRKRQMKNAGRNVRICVGTLGEDATAVGATCQLLEGFFESGGKA